MLPWARLLHPARYPRRPGMLPWRGNQRVPGSPVPMATATELKSLAHDYGPDIFARLHRGPAVARFGGESAVRTPCSACEANVTPPDQPRCVERPEAPRTTVP